jgi:hypothetical protein
MLVATAEPRGVLQSSVASKSILRAVADECARHVPYIDYFPSYEIITGPQATGRFFDATLRDVNEAGVQLVMDTFFRTRVLGAGVPAQTAEQVPDSDAVAMEVARAIQVECDEILLDQRA